MDIPAHDYRDHGKRLASFSSWEHSHLSGEELARAGFYYTGEGDHVRCAYCKTRIGEWEPDDDVVIKHCRISPRCDFAVRAQFHFASSEGSMSQQLSPGCGMENPSTPSAPPDDSATQHMSISTPTNNPTQYMTISSVSSEDCVFEMGNEDESPQDSAVCAAYSGKQRRKQEDVAERLKCKVCMEAELRIAIHPCGHFCLCVRCARRLKSCPICRCAIKARHQIYLC